MAKSNLKPNRKIAVTGYRCRDCGHRKVWPASMYAPERCCKCHGESIDKKEDK